MDLNQYPNIQETKKKGGERDGEEGKRQSNWHLRLFFFFFFYPFSFIMFYLEAGLSDKEDEMKRMIQRVEMGAESPK